MTNDIEQKIRREIATAAMQGLLVNREYEGGYSMAAKEAVKYADALIAELNVKDFYKNQAVKADTESTDIILRKPEVLKLVKISAPTLWRKVKSGDFPAPLQLGARSIGWLESDIQSWIESKISDRNKNITQE